MLSHEPGHWQSELEDGRIQCDLCPRRCKLVDGQRGFCFVRQRAKHRIELTTYGRTTGLAADPIEKKPLNHFFPGSRVLSFGTVGCNLGCRFCQNWQISKARDMAGRTVLASPDRIVEAACSAGCESVAFTYNDPVIFAEYAVDTARCCHEHGVKTVAVTAGYISPCARAEFFRHMDAANVDLKAFNDEFYRKFCFGRLEPVLDTLRYLVHETQVWVEITTLLIPNRNDSVPEVQALCQWIRRELGASVPLHFSAFHPDFRMTDLPRTSAETCLRARDQALAEGLQYVYTGNVQHPPSQCTYCPSCHAIVIQREGYRVRSSLGLNGSCARCGSKIAGRFADVAS